MHLVLLLAQNQDVLIGPTHLLYKSSEHDAAYWSAVAAGISAFTSVVGIGTAIISTWYAHRSARASEMANVRATRASITLRINVNTLDNGEEFPLLIENTGPGTAHVFRVWPSEAILVSTGEFLSPNSRQLFVDMRAADRPIPAGGFYELSLENLGVETEKTFVADWEDSVGNREQIQFRVSSDGQILYLRVLGTATLIYEDMMRRRRRRQWMQKWQARLPWSIYKHIRTSTTPE